MSKICSMANRKLNVLSRMRSFLSAEKRRIIFKSFIESQLKYCPSNWIFSSRKSNDEINRLHEISLRIVNNDYKKTYEELLFHNMTVFLFMTRIYTVWLLKYTKLLMICQWEVSKMYLILKINIPYISL